VNSEQETALAGALVEAAVGQALTANSAPGNGDGQALSTSKLLELLQKQAPDELSRLAARHAHPDGTAHLKQWLAEEVSLSNEQVKAIVRALPLVEYEQNRKAIAKKWGLRVEALDELRRPSSNGVSGNAVQSKVVTLTTPVAWSEYVDGATLLDEIDYKIRKHVVLAPSAAHAVSLYIALTYIVPQLQICPLLIIRSALKRSGKTTLLGILSRLVFRALGTASLSPAVLFRLAANQHPTFLIDEIDAIFSQKNDTSEALRGLLNAGNDRTSSTVYRCEGESFDVVGFDCFGPKVLSGIGRRADTLEDRAISIDMRRKLESEKMERFSVLDDSESHNVLRSKLARWALDWGAEIGRYRPTVPAELNDRAADNWTPLLAIADLAGGDWPTLARQAALELSGPGTEEEQDYKVELLREIERAFEEAGAATDRLTTAQLVEALVGMEESPWATFNSGKPIDARRLARLLKPFGIHSIDIRVEGAKSSLKGYKRESFSDAWSRYIRDSATNDEKQHENKAPDGRVPVAGRGIEVRQDSVADSERNRDECATRGEEQESLFSQENQGLPSECRVVAPPGGGRAGGNIEGKVEL
jgi:putative DNA primase/helicase